MAGPNSPCEQKIHIVPNKKEDVGTWVGSHPKSYVIVIIIAVLLLLLVY
jgi:hypothetical protein